MHSKRKSLRRNNDLAWIGRWNGRNHGGLENASAAWWKNGPTRELHHVLQSHPGRRGSFCRRNYRHLFHFQILPGILPEHPRYLRLKLSFPKHPVWQSERLQILEMIWIPIPPEFKSHFWFRKKQLGSLSGLYPLQSIPNGIKGYKVRWVINLQ